MKPIRVQRKRTKGFKMPENTVYVGRPGKFGNPYKIGDNCVWGIIRGGKSLRGHLAEANGEPKYYTVQDTIDGFKERVLASEAFQRIIKRQLAGKNLACWCPLDKPCHADVLLEFAND